MRKGADTVIFVCSNDLASHSAANVNVMEMCNAFRKNRFHAVLCVPDFDFDREQLFAYYGIEYPFRILKIAMPRFVRGGMRGRAAIFSVLATVRLARTDNAVLYTRDPWIFFLVCTIVGKRCFFESHQFDFLGRLQTGLYRAMVKWGVGSGNGRIVSISTALMNKWTKYGIRPSRITVAHDAVNVGRYSDRITKTAARQQLGLPVDCPFVVYTGSLIPGKGVEVLIKCANRLTDIRFVIVGGELDQIAGLEGQATSGNVMFAGSVPPSRVHLYQAAADVLALPNATGSLIDDVTSPMKLFEYLAAERPIVATDMPSLLEILTHGYNALISRAGDDDGMARHIRLLLETPAQGSLLAANARKDLEKYSWDARVRTIARHF